MENQKSTQVNFLTDDMLELKKKNKKLENLHYNTLFNSGKQLSLHDEIQQINDNDELISLRKEFRNVIQINKQLKNEKYRYHCCSGSCCIL